MPVTFSILTNIVTFLPLYFVPGTMGKIFKCIPLVVTVVFLISLLESIFVLPAHLGHYKERKRNPINALFHRAQQGFSGAFTKGVNQLFGPFLNWTLTCRYAVVALSFALFAGTVAFALSGRMGFDTFPTVESDFARVDVTLPYGAAVEKTEAIVSQLEESLSAVIEECGRRSWSRACFPRSARAAVTRAA